MCPQVQDEGPVLLRTSTGPDEAESLVEMDGGEVEMLMKEVIESKESVM